MPLSHAMAKTNAAPGKRARLARAWGAQAHARLGAVLAAACRDAAGPAPDPDRARRLRVALKETRALLRLLQPALGHRAVAALSTARRLRHALAAARESQALAILAQSLCDDLSARPAAVLRAAFGAAVLAAPADRVIGPVVQCAEPGGTGVPAAAPSAAWRTDLETLAGQLIEIGATAAQADIAEALTTTYRRARHRGRRALRSGVAADLHAWRSAVTDHRYQLDLVTPAWPAMLGAWSKAVRRLRAQLGAYNDLAELAAHPALRAAPANARQAILRLIARRMRKHERRAAAAYDRLFAERPGDFRRRIAAILDTGPPEAGLKDAASPGG